MKFAYLLFGLVLLCSLVHCFEYTHDEAQTKLADAENAIDDAHTAVSDNYGLYKDYISKCTGAKETYNDAKGYADLGSSLYDQAYDKFNHGDYNTAFSKATDSIIYSVKAKDVLTDMERQIGICQAEELRQMASNEITLMKAESARAWAVVQNKMDCPGVAENFNKAEQKYTLANTIYTGGDYDLTKKTAEDATQFYIAAEQAAQACGAQPPQQNTTQNTSNASTGPVTIAPGSCNMAADCQYNEACQDGKCTVLQCSNGYPSNHVCMNYECTADSDCVSSKRCSDHYCVDKPVEQTPVKPPATSGLQLPSEIPFKCSVGYILLFAFVGMLATKKI
ncbi:MAG: hypothetical protein V1492_01400 [Candidatus Micrarchaeota archaeon]